MDCGPHQAWASPWSAANLATVATAALYLRGWLRIRRIFPEMAASCRPSLFLGGLLLSWIVIGSPLSTLDHRLLTFHMLQHLVLMTVAAPLLLAGSPAAPLLRGLPAAFRRATVWLLRSRRAARIGRALTHPITCWIAGTGVVIAWHIPPAHELGMGSPTWHLVQYASFLAGGILFWWPVMNPGRRSTSMAPLSAPLYLFLATLPCDALSAFLSFCGHVIYASHQSAPPAFGLTALQDQECAGALMWFWVTIAYLLPAAAVTLRMLAPREQLAGAAGDQTLARLLKKSAAATVGS